LLLQLERERAVHALRQQELHAVAKEFENSLTSAHDTIRKLKEERRHLQHQLRDDRTKNEAIVGDLSSRVETLQSVLAEHEGMASGMSMSMSGKGGESTFLPDVSKLSFEKDSSCRSLANTSLGSTTISNVTMHSRSTFDLSILSSTLPVGDFRQRPSLPARAAKAAAASGGSGSGDGSVTADDISSSSRLARKFNKPKRAGIISKLKRKLRGKSNGGYTLHVDSSM
jgi:hypothetical protein